jgi:translocation and assembly module TamB
MKILRVLLKVLVITLAGLLVVAGGLWTWGGTGTSLLTTLDRLARYLPPGQTLTVQDVTGSLRGGGSIGLLRWQQGELTVEARKVQIGWTLQPLLNGELRVGQLSAQHLRIEDRRAPAAPAPLIPPSDLRLPIRVDVPFKIDTVEWIGSTTLQATQASGHYIFDSYSHKLDKGQVHISSGSYNFSGSLQALAPMALTAQLDGTVQTTVPNSDLPVVVLARATLSGELATPDATLALAATLTPEPVASASATLKQQPPLETLQASITAQIKPWHLQPIASANARWQALDLAALWPQAPRTQLSGQASVMPTGAGWLGNVQLSNALSGSLDQQRLPLNNLSAQVTFVDQQWAIKSLQATGAGGRLTAEGEFSSVGPQSTQPVWQGSAAAFGLNTAALDSRLAATALDGQLTAQQTPNGIRFKASLQPASKQKPRAAANALAGLRLTQVQAQGLWNAPTLTLDTLQIATDDAQLQGQLTFDTATQALQGKLALTAPGVQADLAGQLASTRGQGDLRLNVPDAALASRWLQQWPGLMAPLGAVALQGGAELTGRWEGGWQQQGQALQLKAQLRAPKLDLRTADQSVAQAWRLRDWQADLAGSLKALNLSLSGSAEQATRRFTLQAAAQGGRIQDGHWQAGVGTLQFSALDSARPGTWLLQLGDPVTLDWQQSASSQLLKVSGGTARLSGPAPGNALVTWQPLRWSQQTKGDTDWVTQGRLQNLPLGWLELLGQTQLANLGLRGDMVFGGAWDATGGSTLKLRAVLERTSGDLQLQADEATAKGSDLRAGVRDARLLITADGDQVSTSLFWNSERAGQIQAQASTRLQLIDGAWRWPLNAPVSGTLSAKLPPVGAWSVLAPPGWRLRGTFNADATLSGTRSLPKWRGNLSAQDLAVRSVVDGIDFSNGSLRATLDGQRLDIIDFSLQGAGGPSGGKLSITGNVQWLTPTTPPADGTADSRLRMALNATAQNLRISARADRRLSVSGTLTALLSDARLSLRGKLTADQALFILPEDSAPRLGDDVRVRQASERLPNQASVPVKTGTPVVPELAITLDLGSNFELRGRGLSTRLAGSLELTTLAGATLVPRLSGQLRTVRGTYKAYGQQLDIERGVLRFEGPFDNPALDVLALRPNLQQRVGVQISGTALSPIVRLYAQPELPDAEKLSWLILGRSAASGGAEAALLQQAAMALLGGSGPGLSGNLAAALGLDELSMRGSATSSDGTTTGATVTLGKRVSQDFYVAYESSLAGAMGTLYIFYDLSRRFTLRAQAGEQSAIDLIFTLRYD